MITWIHLHWALILAIGGPIAASAVATLISVFGDPDHNPATPPPAWVQLLLWLQRWASLYAPEGFKGIAGTRLSVPFLHVPGRNKPGAAGKLPLPVIALLFLPLYAMGCAFGQCVLGHIKAAEETLIVDVGTALPTLNWQAALEALIPIAGETAVDCTVQAIVAYEQQKQAAASAKKTGRMLAEPPSPVLDHGLQWLERHKAMSCAPRRTS